MYQTTLPASWETCRQQLEPDIQRNWFKIGKGIHQDLYGHPAYLNCVQSTSCEMPGWKAQAGIKSAMRNFNKLKYVDNTTLMAESEED